MIILDAHESFSEKLLQGRSFRCPFHVNKKDSTQSNTHRYVVLSLVSVVVWYKHLCAP